MQAEGSGGPREPLTRKQVEAGALAKGEAHIATTLLACHASTFEFMPYLFFCMSFY